MITEVNKQQEEFINLLLSSVPTYKRFHSVAAIINICKTLPDKAKILVIGCGAGAEYITFNKYTSNAKVTAVDNWKEKFKNKTLIRVHGLENTEDNFKDNCNKFKVPVNSINADITNVDKFFNLIDNNYDLIYYDALDGDEPEYNATIKEILLVLYERLNDKGILMGDDYYLFMPDRKLTPIVDSLEKQVEYDINYQNNHNFHWIIRKN